MLDVEFVEVGRVAVAYDLDEGETNSLVDAVGCYFGPSGMGLFARIYPVGEPYTHEKAEEFAKQFVTSLPCIDQLSDPDEWKKLAPLFGVKDSNIDYGSLAIGLEEHDLPLHAMINWYSAILSLVLRDASLINKTDCIVYLHSCGYPLKREVKGLTHDVNATVFEKQKTKITPEQLESSSADYMAQGGSRPQTDKIKATDAACARVVKAIVEERLHLDGRGKIGVNEFTELVKNSMEADQNVHLYQVTATQRFFKSSDKLLPFKRQRGEKK